MRDIENIADIEKLMRKFYSSLLTDKQIGYIFTDIAKLDLEEHLPHISKFWENTLFHTGGYKRNVTRIHQDIDEKESLKPEHFKRWIEILTKTINETHSGNIAEKMKLKAGQIGMTLQAKLGHYS